MLSLQYLREHADEVRAALATRHTDTPLDQILELDAQRRSLLAEVEALKAERNAAGKRIGAAADPQERQRLINAMRGVSERVDRLDAEVREVEERLQALMLEMPNVPHPHVPLGEGEEDNVVVRQWGEPPALDFQPKPHWDLGEALGIIDFERGVKLAGSRFYVLRGLGARLERALIQFFLDVHTREHGYTELYLPYLVREDVLVGAGQLPKFREELYRDVQGELWLIPTAEVPITNLHRDEILPADALPLNYVAYTPCFRREKMSAGRDVRGIKRVHQFDKVEMYKIVRPEESDRALEDLLADAEDLCRRLGIPYRVVQLCTGDLGFAMAMTYDIEMWAPGQGEWLEVSSCSNATDFQARRANLRFRRGPGARPEFVHTLNGSGLALPRVVIAILENYQQPDGSVRVPEVLQPYMGTDVIR